MTSPEGAGGLLDSVLGKLSGIFSEGNIAQQFLLWGVLMQLAQPILQPLLQDLAEASAKADPNMPLSPPELAEAVVRGFLDQGDASEEARKGWISDGRFQTLVELAGDAPAPQELLELLRRGFIPWDDGNPDGTGALQGLHEGRLADKWAPILRNLTVQLPSWQDALRAWLEGQLSEEEARSWYLKAGGDPDAFQWLYDTEGASPTPNMLGEMANRGVIPWDGTGPTVTTFAQGFLEGPWRNKWEPAMRAIQEYLPPPRTVTALQRAGSITQAQALALYQQHGLSPQLAAAYVQNASVSTATHTSVLTASDVLAMMTDQLISAQQATTELEGLGATPAEAAQLVAYTNVKVSRAQLTAAVSRVRANFTARKIDGAAATSALAALDIPADQAQAMLSTWEVELKATVKVLSEAQYADAWAYGILTQNQAQAGLEAMGYDQLDAWTILSIKNKAPLPGKPG